MTLSYGGRRGAIAFLLALLSLALVPVSALAQANPIQVENAKPGTTAWELPGMGPNNLPSPSPAIQGYASTVSVAPGDDLQLHVSTSPAAPYRIEIYRLGWYGGAGGRLIACLPSSDCTTAESGVDQPIPSPDPNTGELDAGWPVTDSITVGSDWTTGYYIAKLILTGTSPPQANWIPFIVRAPWGTSSAILVQASVNTWQAYDNWPGPPNGKSLYTFNSSSTSVPASNTNAAAMVSFNRPFGTDQNSGPFMWEYNLVRYLERNGYDVSYQTDVDSDQNASSLLGHTLDIANGHDEYWTPNMRNNWEAARAAGVNLAFVGGNVDYWQARYADNWRTLVEYKNGALDPLHETDRSASSYVNRPECTLLGVGYDGGSTATPPLDYYVSAPSDPWFTGTGFAAGDTLYDTVGYEWDTIQPGCNVPTLTTLLSFGGVSGSSGNDRFPAQAVVYTDPSGARVFSTSTMQLTWALDDFGHKPHVDARAQVLFANIFNDLGGIPAPVLEQPAPGATVASPATFSWSTSMGVASYQLIVNGSPVATMNASACAGGTCSVSAPVPAGSDAWTVSATDLDGASVTSQPQTFTVPDGGSSAPAGGSNPPAGGGSSPAAGGGSSTPSAGGLPAPSSLMSPRARAVVWNPRPRFAWTRARAGEAITQYQVFIDGRLAASTRATTYTPRTSLATGRHTWMVMAFDKSGASASTRRSFVVRPVRAVSHSRAYVLAHGLTLHVFCPGRCLVNARVRIGRRGPASSTQTARLRGHGAVAALTLSLSAAMRSRLGSARSAVLYLTVSTHAGGSARATALKLRWTRAGLVGS